MSKKLKKTMKSVYLASPFTHKDKEVEEHREKEITRIAGLLTLEYGYMMFLPITQSAAMKRHHSQLGTTFEAWKDIDLHAVSICEELWVVMMEGWKESVGVQAEIEHAKQLKKPIRYIHHQTLEFYYD